MALVEETRGELRDRLPPYAPRLAVALGGPYEGEALALLGIALAGSGTAPPSVILQGLSKPDFRQRLREAENYWAAYVIEQPMRAQESRHEVTVRRLAYITTFGFFALVAMLLGASIVPEAASRETAFRDVLLAMTGVMGAGWVSIISFYFGAGVGTRQQARTISSVIEPLLVRAASIHEQRPDRVS
jgi:hypothetical protein